MIQPDSMMRSGELIFFIQHPDLKLNNTPKPKLSTAEKGGSKIEISNWIYSDIGKGGLSFMFTTHHGDVILRKKK